MPMNTNTDFSGSTVIITGASGNLGRAVVKKYLKADAKLILFDRNLDLINLRFPEIKSHHDKFYLSEVDVTNPTSIDRAVAKSLEWSGRIEILINTIGGFYSGKALHETPGEKLDFMINLNLNSVFLMCKQVIPIMIDQRFGKIVNIAARPGLKGTSNSAAYSAAKSGVIRFTESMSAELKHKGINVNCVIPGTIDTPQNREEMPDSDFARWVKPNQIADVILFLTSEEAVAINGAAVPVYGRS
jgi:NAD(P)-dependent dehydrogenase (short-subunit alcohol dehydrogenase family)